MKLSVVVPVFNEEQNIAPLYNELIEVFKDSDVLLEIIFINDTSTDQTLNEVQVLAHRDNRIVVIDLPENMGQSYATMRGIQAANGELTAFLDGDMQNDARDLPQMIESIKSGYQLVCGWRKERKDKKIFVVSSRIANLIIRALFGIKTHDSGCSLRVTYTKHLKQIKFFEHFHRYIPILLAMQKLQIGEVIVNHRARASGESKYSILKSFSVIKELIFLRFYYTSH